MPPNFYCLSLFPEVGGAEAFGGLVFALVAHAGQDQHDDGDYEGEHFVQLLDCQIRAGGQEQVEDVQAAEQEGGQNAQIRTPDAENNNGDGQPAPVAKGIVGPDAAGVIHDVVQSAQPCDHGAEAGRGVFIAHDIDARRIGCAGIFAHCAQMQTRARAVEDVGGDKRDDYRRICQKAV